MSIGVICNDRKQDEKAKEGLRRESAWEGAREDLCGGGRVSQSCAEGRDGVVASRRR